MAGHAEIIKNIIVRMGFYLQIFYFFELYCLRERIILWLLGTILHFTQLCI